MNIFKSLCSVFIVCAVGFLAGCETEYQRPVIVDSISRAVYKPIEIPEIEYTPVKPKEIPVSRGTLSGKTIIVDPGHGGKDPGAGSIGYSDVPEKVINLDIAQELAVRLRAKGANVIMSRNDDTFIELDDRAALAESKRADLLISIHADAHSNRYISGATIYTANGCSWKSRKVAQNILNNFSISNIKCRGIRSADFRVLAKHSRPAVLVECGYLTNAYEAKDLNNQWYRKKIATTLANGIADSF